MHKYRVERFIVFAAQALLGITLLTGMLPVHAQDAEPACQNLRYTFSWSLDGSCSLEPRGGTTTGTEVTLDPEPSPGWLALREEGISIFERDRRAILAMAGPYRTSFEFLEIAGYTPDFERAPPYHSWSTEYVYVVEDQEDFISLQHIIVMFIEQENGEIRGPFVQKHWRQDWQYEESAMLEYTGNQVWRWRELSEGESRGQWVQSVFQVDDSPRYASVGQWQHYPNFSTWIGNQTLRPLPRREWSVRDDYDVLEGSNRHTITPDGWMHEEENYKVKLDADGNPAQDQPYLAKELGVNRYQRIVDFDFSGGDEYWSATEDYWQTVREVWEEYFSADDEIRIISSVDDVPMFVALFQLANDHREDATNMMDLKAAIRSAIEPYIQ